MVQDKMQQAWVYILALGDRLRDRGERGVTAIEYGLLLFLIAIVIVGAVTLLGKKINSVFQSAADVLP